MRIRALTNHSEAKLDSVDVLLNQSSLLPGTVKRLLDSAKKIYPQSAFKVLEDLKINQVLQDCENVAVLLPHKLCLNLGKGLSKMKLTGKSYMGKETWFDSEIGIKLRGFVSPSILEGLLVWGKVGFESFGKTS